MMRSVARAVVHGAAAVLSLPFVGWARLGLLWGSEQPYSSMACALALLPGLPGILLRRAFYCQTLKCCRWDLTVCFGALITHPTARIGSNVWIGGYSLIGRCSISDNVLIASRVSVLSGRHPHRFDDPSKPIQGQGGAFVEIQLGADSWLGEGSIVMADLGRGCVVGAGAVVVKPVNDFAVVVGNPARQVSTRGQTQSQ